MATKETKDPYDTYRDGFCRDASGQIVNCESDQAISPAKNADGSIKFPAVGAKPDKS